ncbi:hypothetical protein CDAR_56341 [Caerostris darwini]|uniref:Uncharacterized protein n=1 Tax=Caerostris darwini TaxID=1538125 RepID=A0AAV4WMA8_9ARAC|nr:hypothetical protein CDAR_56341 [Caerostris darwini]
MNPYAFLNGLISADRNRRRTTRPTSIYRKIPHFGITPFSRIILQRKGETNLNFALRDDRDLHTLAKTAFLKTRNPGAILQDNFPPSLHLQRSKKGTNGAVIIMIAVTVKKFFPVFKVVLTLMVEAYGNHDHLYARLQVRRYTVVYSGFRMPPSHTHANLMSSFYQAFIRNGVKILGDRRKEYLAGRGFSSDMFGDGF